MSVSFCWRVCGSVAVLWPRRCPPRHRRDCGRTARNSASQHAIPASAVLIVPRIIEGHDSGRDVSWIPITQSSGDVCSCSHRHVKHTFDHKCSHDDQLEVTLLVTSSAKNPSPLTVLVRSTRAMSPAARTNARTSDQSDQPESITDSTSVDIVEITPCATSTPDHSLHQHTALRSSESHVLHSLGVLVMVGRLLVATPKVGASEIEVSQASSASLRSRPLMFTRNCVGVVVVIGGVDRAEGRRMRCEA